MRWVAWEDVKERVVAVEERRECSAGRLAVRDMDRVGEVTEWREVTDAEADVLVLSRRGIGFGEGEGAGEGACVEVAAGVGPRLSLTSWNSSLGEVDSDLGGGGGGVDSSFA